VKKLKTDKHSRLMEMAVDDRHERASNTVDRSISAVMRAKRLVAEAHERKEAGGIEVAVDKAQNSLSAVERARELVKQSRQLIAAGRKRRQG
jgi:hypothetical protein